VKNGSPLGYKFLNVLASKEGQACFSNAIQYAASNKDVVYDPKIKPRVATESGSLWISFDKVAELTPTWIEMWNKQIGR
jgi:putative spermidine/putrescine transport system substrate-binding protein